MDAIHLILNLAALLLWFSWRSFSFLSAPDARTSALSLLSTLHRTDSRKTRRWISLVGLFGLLFVRSFIYWHIGSAVSWTPLLDLGAIALAFRSDYPQLMVLFSFLSFGLLLGLVYTWLLFLSALNRSVSDLEPFQKLVRLQLGWLHFIPAPLSLLLPMILAAVIWAAGSPALVYYRLIPPTESSLQLFQQSLLFGLACFLSLRWLLLVLLIVYLLNSYVYLGNFSLWSYVEITARNLMRPFSALPLRIGRVDLTPLIGIVLVVIVSELVRFWLPKIYQQLPP